VTFFDEIVSEETEAMGKAKRNVAERGRTDAAFQRSFYHSHM